MNTNKQPQKAYNKTVKNEDLRLRDEFARVTSWIITDDQEKQIINLSNRIFGDIMDVKITGQTLTPKGQEAISTHRDRMVKILGGQADEKDTLNNGAVRTYVDIFTTKNEQVDLLTTVQKIYNIKDISRVEEKLAEDFINYAKTHEGVSGTIKEYLDRVYLRVMCYLCNENEFKKLFTEIFTKEFLARETKTSYLYIDNFYFSPFEIRKNVVSIWIGDVIIKDSKIFHKQKEISPEEFYDLFVSNTKDTWFVKDFIRFFKDCKKIIPDAMNFFAIYCDCKFTFLPEDIFKEPDIRPAVEK